MSHFKSMQNSVNVGTNQAQTARITMKFASLAMLEAGGSSGGGAMSSLDAATSPMPGIRHSLHE
jgi:hypothetical protein